MINAPVLHVNGDHPEGKNTFEVKSLIFFLIISNVMNDGIVPVSQMLPRRSRPHSRTGTISGRTLLWI
jgi:hypothetical protein